MRGVFEYDFMARKGLNLGLHWRLDTDLMIFEEKYYEFAHALWKWLDTSF